MSLAPASPWVLRFISFISENGTVLDVACGSGRHLRAALAAGHSCTGVDRDLSHIVLRDEERAQIELVEMNLETTLENDNTRAAAFAKLFARERYAGVIVTNYLHRPLFPVIIDSLAPDGILIYETFARGNERFGRPSRPEFLLESGELLRAVDGHLEVLAYEHGERHQPRPAVIQSLCARKRKAH